MIRRGKRVGEEAQGVAQKGGPDQEAHREKRKRREARKEPGKTFLASYFLIVFSKLYLFHHVGGLVKLDKINTLESIQDEIRSLRSAVEA